MICWLTARFTLQFSFCIPALKSSFLKPRSQIVSEPECVGKVTSGMFLVWKHVEIKCKTRLPSNRRWDHPRMRVTYSMFTSSHVTKIWQIHHSIRRTRKPHAACKHQALCLTERELYCRSKSYIAGIGIFDLFGAWDLDLTRWPSYTNLTRSAWRYAACANMKFLRQGFRKLSSDRHIHTNNYKRQISTYRPFRHDQHYTACHFTSGQKQSVWI